MRRTLLILAVVLAPFVGAGAAEAADRPDFKVRCKNGKYSKVWLAPLKAVNNCGNHSKQWLEVHIDSHEEMDNDPLTISVQAGARYVNQYDWHVPTQHVRVRLGRGVFCHQHGSGSEPDLDVMVIYRKGSTWRPDCP